MSLEGRSETGTVEQQTPGGERMDAHPMARVLVVDDEPSVLETMAALLSQVGYAVVTAGSVEEALTRLHAEPFEVALTDLRLEGASGLSLLGELRRHWPDTMAIVLTGYGSLESAVEALRHGAFDYLMKPIQVEDLKATVARAAERSTLGRGMRERIANLDAFAQEMQRRVDEMTRALAQKIRELGEAHRQREQFIEMIAHEIGQPITTVSGYAQLLQRGDLSAEVQERARRNIVRELARLSRLVHDFTIASHMAAGRFRVELVACNLAAIVREQVESAQMETEVHVLRLDAPPGEVAAVCDPDRVAQVLSNLLGNAIKYTPGGEIRVSLRVEGEQALLSITDEGPGIPAERLEAIFDPYVRLASGQARAPRGTGLGLYIARGIARAHGGDLWAESKSGAGATFIVRLPLLAAGAAALAAEADVGGEGSAG